MSSIKDVANLAGVAPSSVTRALNGHPHVSAELSARVFRAVEELQYRPDLNAVGLRRGTSQTVGIIVSDLTNPSIANLVDCLEVSLRGAGYSLLLVSSHGDPSMDVEGIELFRQRRVDGLVVMCVDEDAPELETSLMRWTGPIVLIDRQIKHLDDASVVLSSHRQGTARLISHLLDIGHRKIGYIDAGLQGSRYVWSERMHGLHQAYEAHDIAFDAMIVKQLRATPESGRAATAQLLDGDDRPTALVAAPNLMLNGALVELRRRGMRVGDDIALACLDDVPVAELHEPPITSLHRDVGEVARAAATLLLARLKRPSTRPRTVVLPSELLLRDSTASALSVPG